MVAELSLSTITATKRLRNRHIERGKEWQKYLWWLTCQSFLWEVYLLISASIYPGSADRPSGRATCMAFRHKRQLPQYIPLLLSKAIWGKWVVRGSTVFPEEFGCIWRLWFLHLDYKAGTEGKERESERENVALYCQV